MHSGFATPEATLGFASRFPSHQKNGFFRGAQGLTCSSLGLGTYLGGLDDHSSERYVQAVSAAVRGGVNFLDTAINYRHQRSERDIGAALKALFKQKEVRREEVVLCTKAGFLTPDAVPVNLLQPSDIVGGMHSMKPEFLEDQVDRSRRNLGVETIDVLYLHNPETQLSHVPETGFYDRIRAAFGKLEELVAAGRIRYYGTATWNGYRSIAGTGERLSLVKIAGIAKSVGGEHHHFRFVQLPFNMGMTEAFTQRYEAQGMGDPRGLLNLAHNLGITVVASATLYQGRLLQHITPQIAARLPGATSDAQRAIQFTRSTPGVAVALVGMGNPEHVADNLGVAKIAPVPLEDFMRFFRREEG